jgi:hypothetical protein
MKQGESALYAADGSGQMVYHRVRGDEKDGIYMLTLDDEDSQQSASLLAGENGQKSQKRFVSCRHVEKKKQKRKKQGSGAGQGGGGGGGGGSADQLAEGGGGGGGGQGQDDHKHEGDKINTETRWTKEKIEFYADDKAVGWYDKQKKEWVFKGKVRLGDENADKHVVAQKDNLTDVGGKEVYVYTKSPHAGEGIHDHPHPALAFHQLEELIARIDQQDREIAQLKSMLGVQV